MLKVVVAGCLTASIWLCSAPAHASTGSWERAWGKDVGGIGVNLCTLASSCLAGASGTGTGEFDTAQGVATDGAGNVYVTDTDQQRVEKFDPNGNFLLQFGTPGTAAGHFQQPTDVAIGASGDVYVTDLGNARIDQFSSAGTFVRAWGNDVGGAGVNVCDGGATPCQTGSGGGAGGEFGQPTGVGTDAGGNVYVADAANEDIQKFAADGTFQLKWGRGVNNGAGFETCTSSCVAGGSGSLGGEMNQPNDVTVDPAGHVYVADSANRRVQQFDTSGGFVRTWGNGVNGGAGNLCAIAASCTAGTAGTLGDEFAEPFFVSADAGALYVSDRDNNRVQKFSPAGGFLRAWGLGVDAGRPGAYGVCTVASSCQAGTADGHGGSLSAPLGVAAGPGGTVFVGDFGNARVDRFVIATPALTLVSPASPANQNSPVVSGFGEPGTTVRLFGNSGCTGTPLASGPDSAFANGGITVPVPDDSATALYADTLDDSNQTSSCSGTPLTYVEDSTAPDTLLDSPPSGAITDRTPTIAFHASEAHVSFMCRFDAGAFAPCPGTAATPTSPLPEGAHTFDVVAGDVAGNIDPSPARASFTVRSVLPQPVRGRLVNAVPEKGVVLVKVPAGKPKAHAAASRFVPLATLGAQVPVGSTLDTSRGTVRLTAATGRSSGTQTGHFNGGLFVLGQSRKNPLTTLSMTGGRLNSCGKVPRGGSPKVLAARKRRRTLFSNVHGHFRTRSRNSTATVRGTRWQVTDTCSGTLTKVTRGRVAVRDLRKHRTVIVRKGHRYFARSR